MGTSARGVTGYKGFYYHFLDMRTGLRYSPKADLSTIDTALFLAGVLFCQSYFDGKDPAELEVRQIAKALFERVDWVWAAHRDGAVSLSWTPEAGFKLMAWRGYNEAMILYVLGLASPTAPLPDSAWKAWTTQYAHSWVTHYGQTYLAFPPLFGHQFSHVWVDFRGIRDAFMQDKGLDYFENSRRATYAQQAYAIANPMHWKAYGEALWGVTASAGPVDKALQYAGETRMFRSYAGRGLGGASTYDDGTLAPNGAAGSLPFAPEIALPALQQMQQRYGTYIYSTMALLTRSIRASTTMSASASAAASPGSAGLIRTTLESMKV